MCWLEVLAALDPFAFADSGTYAVVRSEIPLHSTYHESGAQAYEVPVSRSATSASSVLNEAPTLATHYEMPTSNYVNTPYQRQESKNSMYSPPPPSWKPGSQSRCYGSPRSPGGSEVLYEMESLPVAAATTAAAGSGLLCVDRGSRNNDRVGNTACSEGSADTVKAYEVPFTMEKTTHSQVSTEWPNRVLCSNHAQWVMTLHHVHMYDCI